MSNEILKFKGYFGSIKTDIENDILHGKIEFIDDLITYEGNSVSELKKAFEEAVDDYIQYCEENNIEPNLTYKGSFNIRIGQDLHKKTAEAALLSGKSLNEFIREVIEKEIKTRDSRREPMLRLKPLASYRSHLYFRRQSIETEFETIKEPHQPNYHTNSEELCLELIAH